MIDPRGAIRNIFSRIGAPSGASIAADILAISTGIGATSVGNLQVAATTEELDQAAATYDLFTGTTQDVVLEKLMLRMPDVDISGGSLTSISIQTNDSTPQVYISAANGVLANLTQEAQLGWTGVSLIKAGTKIQLTIAGGAADVACACDIVAECRAVVAGGILA